MTVLGAVLFLKNLSALRVVSRQLLVFDCPKRSYFQAALNLLCVCDTQIIVLILVE